MSGDLLLKMELHSDPGMLCVVRAAMEQLTDVFGFSAPESRSVTRAVDEALTNIMRHSYGGQVDRPIEILCHRVPKRTGTGDGFEVLLTDRGPAAWHPASVQDRQVFSDASEFCRLQGTSISQLALQFASQNPDIPTTMFSSANPESVRRNVAWHEEPYDQQLLVEVQARLRPVMNKQWSY